MENRQSGFCPSRQEARALASTGEYRAVPVGREIPAGGLTPIDVLQILKNVSRHCFLLESMEDREHWGRYTFLGFDPLLEVTCQNGLLRIVSGTTVTEQTYRPAHSLRRIIAENRSPRLDCLPPFTGGLVGYFAYEYIKYSEPTLKLYAEDEAAFKDLDLMLFDKVIAFDNLRQTIFLIANARTAHIDTEYNKAKMEIGKLEQLLRAGRKAPNPPPRLKGGFRSLFSEAEYCGMVRQAQHHIHEGDIFQVVLSNRLEADMEGSLLDAYRVLRTSNPSPYMFYFASDDIEIAGASPETLVKLENGRLHTFPLAGTRPRGATPEEDRALEAELLSDPKELAEHNMLVDLGRNDLGRISRIGSVEVEQYLSVERFSHVMHLGSTVAGDIRPDCDALDAIEAVLPAGTLSGAPKIRACQIINELENNRRGIYGGAIGYLDFNGNLDTCIAIRLAYLKDGRVHVRSGAGIVADSVPESEYQECLNKARAVVRAIETAERGLDQ